MLYLSESEIRWSSYIVHSGTPNCTLWPHHLSSRQFRPSFQVTPPIAKLYRCLACREYIQRTDQNLLLEAKLRVACISTVNIQHSNLPDIPCLQIHYRVLPLMVSQFPKFDHQAQLYNTPSCYQCGIKQPHRNISDILFHVCKSLLPSFPMQLLPFYDFPLLHRMQPLHLFLAMSILLALASSLSACRNAI